MPIQAQQTFLGLDRHVVSLHLANLNHFVPPILTMPTNWALMGRVVVWIHFARLRFLWGEWKANKARARAR
jgi:hypothetical protein